jgi:hypothetical protein
MQIQGFCNCDDMHYVLNVLDSLSNEFQSVQLLSLLHTLQIHFIYLRFNLNVSENKIKEFEKILRQQRNVQDMADEIDSLKIEKERNEKDLAR